VLYIPFEDDPSGGTIVDRSGNRHDATCTPGSTCPARTQGKRGFGGQFDGSQFAVIPYQPVFDASTLTLATWVFLDQPVDHVPVAKPLGAGDRDAWLLVAFVNRTCAETTVAALGYENICVMPQLSTGTWHHLALRVEATTKTLFIDGAVADAITGTPNVYDTHDVYIGCDSNGGLPVLFWIGRIDEVLFYDRPLSNEEIAMLATP
ncbi:MAG TPA: LamG domain-containing protein, partial [Kofleriaceae bacterium]